MIDRGKGITAADRFSWACPECRGQLVSLSLSCKRCSKCSQEYVCQKGIWRFLSPDRAQYFRRFVEDYEAIRKAEGRGSSDAAYYRALPFEDLTLEHSASWRIRAASYRVLVREVIGEVIVRYSDNARILDLGAGNCWLSNQLSAKGLDVAAVDLSIDARDGLGAHIHYDESFVPVQADFNALPFYAGQFQLAIFNASFHYAVDPEWVLNEVKRVLQDRKSVV